MNKHESAAPGAPVTAPVSPPLVYGPDAHCITPDQLDTQAVPIINKLVAAGYQAYLVGGGIRDLLLGHEPKDFDVTTDARPEQIKPLFRRCRLVGKRFRLALVHYKDEVVDVATFRRTVVQDTPGRILRDNDYGTIEEDAARRDFTVNALYYLPKDGCVHDFTSGMRDLALRQLRIIGDPLRRYQEDPVRMLRALRFAAKLNFTISPESDAPIRELTPLLREVPGARLFDELGKLLLHGHAVRTFELLGRYRALPFLLPGLTELLTQQAMARAMAETALTDTDRRVMRGRYVTTGFLVAALLWPLRVEQAAALARNPGRKKRADASERVLRRQQIVPRGIAAYANRLWSMQRPLQSGRRPRQLQADKHFSAALDLLIIREAAGDDTGGKARWWQEYLGRV